jgi:predicted Na+-dependent transporter
MKYNEALRVTIIFFLSALLLRPPSTRAESRKPRLRLVVIYLAFVI